MFDAALGLSVRLIGTALAVVSLLAAAAPPEFEVTLSPQVHDGPVSTRVYVMLAPEPESAVAGRSAREPRFGPDWFRPKPFFAIEAKDWRPGDPLKVGADALGYPGPLSALEPGTYQAQAVVRLNSDTHKLGDGEGNAYGPAVRFTVPFPGNQDGPIKLSVDKIVPRRRFPESDRLKLVEINSPLLSAFHKRPIQHRAGIILPKGGPGKIRGTVYIIPGFGGDHFMAPMIASSPSFAFGEDLIRVVLDPDCGTGHHVFADSATNGPRGQALVEELIPYIENHFPVPAEPRARLLNGHSSGGWSSLWLQAAYPDFFGGTWSTSPDPVDFRDFQKINLYKPNENMFRDSQGARRPIARQGDRAVLFYDAFSKMEDVIGDGGQLHSFEAVFSPANPEGGPRRLWDRASGAVDFETAKAWEKYDIRLVLERNWDRLGPKLKGKLHIVTGGLDTFYLEGAVELLKTSLAGLGSDAYVEVVPGRDHGSVISRELVARIAREMSQAVGE